MTDYQKHILNQIKNKTEQEDVPSDLSMNVEQDLGISRELNDSSVNDTEYSEIFNDESDVKAHDTDDIEEDEDITEDVDSIAELRAKQRQQKEKKKKNLQYEQSDIDTDEYQSLISAVDAMTGAGEYSEQVTEPVIEEIPVTEPVEQNELDTVSLFDRVESQEVYEENIHQQEQFQSAEEKQQDFPGTSDVSQPEISLQEDHTSIISSDDTVSLYDRVESQSSTEEVVSVAPETLSADDVIKMFDPEVYEPRKELIEFIIDDNVHNPTAFYTPDDIPYEDTLRVAGQNALSSLHETNYEENRTQHEIDLLQQVSNIHIDDESGETIVPVDLSQKNIIDLVTPAEEIVVSDMSVSTAVSTLSLAMDLAHEQIVNDIQKYANDNHVAYEVAKSMLTTDASYTEFQERLKEYDTMKTMVSNIEERGFVTEKEAEFATGKSLGTQSETKLEKGAEADKQITDKATETGSVEKEATEKESQYKGENLHSFTAALQGLGYRLESTGQQIASVVANDIKTADANTAAGHQEIKKFTDPVLDVVSILGYSAQASDINSKIISIKNGGETFDRAVKEGYIDATTFKDLSKSERHELKKELLDAGYKRSDVDTLFKNKDILAGFGSGPDPSSAMNGFRGEILNTLQVEQENLLRSKTILESNKGKMSAADFEAEKSKLAGKLKKNSEEMQRVSSSKFFNLNDDKNIPLMQKYFNNSADDIIRNTLGNGKFNSMSVKDFKKLGKQLSQDNSLLSSAGLQAVKYGKLLKQQQNANIEKGSFNKKLSSKYLGKLMRNVTEGDANFNAGMSEMKRDLTIVRTAISGTNYGMRFGKRILIGTKRGGYHGLLTNGFLIGTKNHKLNLPGVKKILIGTATGGYRGLLSYAMSAIVSAKLKTFVTTDELAKMIRDKKNAIIKKIISKKNNITYASKTTVKKAGTKIVHGINRMMNNKPGRAIKGGYNTTVKAHKAVMKKARELATKTARKTAQIAAAINASKPVRVVSFVGSNFITKPAGKVKDIFGKLFGFINKVKKIIFITIAAFILIYIGLVFGIQMILQLFDNITQISMTTIAVSDDKFMKETITELLERFNERTQIAVEYGTGTPQTQEVWGNHLITKYGRPSSASSVNDEGEEVTTLSQYIPCQYNSAHDHLISSNWINGYRLHYIDKDRNELFNVQNNVKDAITLAYVELNGDHGGEENYKKLINEWFDWLNPEIDPEKDIIESEIYACDGCETVYYMCNDSASLQVDDGNTYVSQQSIQNDIATGAHFYNGVASNSFGDYYIATCKGCEYPKTIYDDCMKGKKDKDGNPLSCPGHIEMFTVDHESAVNRSPFGCNNYKVDLYCTGHQTTACYGHRDVDIYLTVKKWEDAVRPDSVSQEEKETNKIVYYPESYMIEGNVDGFFGTLYKPSYLRISNRTEYKWNSSDEMWITSLYNQDWFVLYGIDPSLCSGITFTATFSQEEIDAILEQLPEDLSELRKQIVETALSLVGQVSYYWGGKPTSYVYPIQTNVGPANYGSTTPDASNYHRTIAGLDCFGTVSYVYWHSNYELTGNTENILPEGCNTTTTTVHNSGGRYGNLYEISASQLQPGDLGFKAGHTGIYIGNLNGKPMWVHNTGGSTSNVVFNDYSGFTKYFRYDGLN